MTKRDWFVEAFGRAITDIREKVVEEPWFGKKLARPGEHARSHADESFAAAAKERSSERDHAHDSHDLDMDR